jgi:(2Fe-2S) ferredoxin
MPLGFRRLSLTRSGLKLNQEKRLVAMKQTCFVCQNVDCKIRGSEKLLNELTGQIAARSLDAEVKPYLCFGACDEGPNIVIYPQKNWYAGVKLEDLPEIVESIAGGPPVQRLDTIDSALKEITYSLLETGVF